MNQNNRLRSSWIPFYMPAALSRILQINLRDHWEVERNGLIRRDQLVQFKRLRKLSLYERGFCRKFVEPEPGDLDMG